MSDRDAGLLEAPATESRWRSRARFAGALIVRLAFDALVIDAAYETWMSPSPIRIGVVVATAAYFGLTVWVLSQGGRIGGPGWLTDPATPLILLIGFLVAATWSAPGAMGGLAIAGQPTAVVLAGATLFVTVLAIYRLAGPPGVRSWWGRGVVVAVGAYAAAALVLAIRARTPYVALLAGDGIWRGLPVVLRGAWLGAFVMPMAGFMREVATSMIELTFRGLFRWMVIFALASWMAINGSSL
jgi:hypothetical protein